MAQFAHPFKRRGFPLCSFLLLASSMLATGCSAFPDVRAQTQLHNPFPQFHRIAILPFFNQSSDPTVNGEKVAEAYYQQLQQIPGFEVMPVGVAKTKLAGLPLEEQTNFQQLAQMLGVDALIIGSITDFEMFYPPRMGLAVNWYAANPGFHPIPPGYGLPWGTAEEEYIPDSLVFEAEFALAREQLKTQTPPMPLPAPQTAETPEHMLVNEGAEGPQGPAALPPTESEALEDAALPPQPLIASGNASGLPADWPDPRGFIPPAPSAQPPACLPQSAPVITHTALYDGNDADFTECLADYFFFQDDARFGGWQAYLQRSKDFIDFCCYLHINQTLTARGGAGKSRVVWRWPHGRYEP